MTTFDSHDELNERIFTVVSEAMCAACDLPGDHEECGKLSQAEIERAAEQAALGEEEIYLLACDMVSDYVTPGTDGLEVGDEWERAVRSMTRVIASRGMLQRFGVQV